MLSRPGLSRSEPRASAQVANVAAGVGRPRPGGSGYRPGRSPPSTHQASGSAKSPRLAYWRETEALEGGDPPEPQNSLMRVGLEPRAQPQVTHRPPAQHRRRIRGALFPTKVSPYSPSSLSPIPLPSRARRAKQDKSPDRALQRRAPTQPAKPCQGSQPSLWLSPISASRGWPFRLLSPVNASLQSICGPEAFTWSLYIGLQGRLRGKALRQETSVFKCLPKDFVGSHLNPCFAVPEAQTALPSQPTPT